MDYVGYFMNEHGEELVVAQRRGDRNARLWHCDAYWEMARVGGHSIRLDGPMEGEITEAGLVINRYEATWLSSRLAASHLCAWNAETYRSDSGPDLKSLGREGDRSSAWESANKADSHRSSVTPGLGAWWRICHNLDSTVGDE